MRDKIEYAIFDACDEGTFEYGTNSGAVVAEMVKNVMKVLAEYPSYELGVTHGFDEAICEVRRGEIDPQTYQRKTTA